MHNAAHLTGYVGNDPEIRVTQDGRKVANFRMATSERWRDKDSGEQRERTEWHQIVAFSPSAEQLGLVKVIEQYVKKGTLVQVIGSIRTREWSKEGEGIKRYTTEVVLQGFDAKLYLMGSGNGSGRPPAADSPDEYGKISTRTSGSQAPIESGGQTPPFDRELDDEIPF